jgi:hypothetical protein
MACSMVGAAQSHEVIELVPAALFARTNMMHVDENAVATTRHLTAMLVSSQHGAPRRRRYGLRRAGRAFACRRLLASA